MKIMLLGCSIIILVLIIIMIGLSIYRYHEFKQPKTIRWQIGNQVFTFQFPFNWMKIKSNHYITDLIVLIGVVAMGLVIFVALAFFLFFFLGILLPIILIIGLVALILFLIFVL